MTWSFFFSFKFNVKFEYIVNHWPDCKASPVYELAKTVCLSVRLSVRRQQLRLAVAFSLLSHKPINDTGVKLGEFVNIDEFFQTSTKFCDLDLDFTLQWTYTDIDFSLFMNGLKGVVLPSSYLMLSWLIVLDDFYWIVTLTLTFPAQGHMVI